MEESTDTSRSSSSIASAITRTRVMSIVNVPLRDQRQNRL
jgi:hypothetical protein